jgi:radical SAM protein with 4Fe4S-binding SPASM domain
LENGQLINFLSGYFPFKNLNLRYEFMYPKDLGLPLSAPIGMYMEVSKKCNLACSHCYKPLANPQTPLTLNQLRSVIDDLHTMGVFEIRICGNEPTSSPHLFEISEYIKSKQMYLGINTNAFFSKAFGEKLISLAPNLFAISIDGNEKTHGLIRGEGSYDRAVSFLTRISNCPIKRRVNSLISKVTIRAMEDVVSLANRFEAEVSFLPLRVIGKSTEFKKENAIDSHDMFFVVREVMRLRNKYPDVTVLTYFDILSGKATYHHSMPFNAPCPARKNGFITYNGDHFPCDFLRYLDKDYFCGNVLEQSFPELWRNSSVLHKFQNLKHGKCLKCRFYMTHCYGGCISGSLSSTGSSDDGLCFADLL